MQSGRIFINHMAALSALKFALSDETGSLGFVVKVWRARPILRRTIDDVEVNPMGCVRFFRARCH
jgi:hypothetical protein